MNAWIITGTKGAKRVVLMSPETDADFFSLGIRRGRRISESIALIHLASYLAVHGWEFEQAVAVKDEVAISNCCRGAVVGITTQINNYSNALCLAAIAKESGARLVVMGGPHATNRAQQIINNQPDVDVVVAGQGEIIFHKLAEGELAKGVVREQHLALDLLPSKKRELWSNIWASEDQGATLFGKRWSLAFWSEGCPQAVCGKPCIFCSIPHAKCCSRRTNDQMIEELTKLKSLNVGAIEIGDDDFPGVVSQQQLSNLLKKVTPNDLHFELFIHARAASVKSVEHLDQLKSLGVRILQVGFESGDPQMKAVASDKATLEQEDQLIEWCSASGAKLQATFMVGMPGETNRSMHTTLDRTRQLANKGVLWSLMVDPLIPLPGSQAFSMLCKEHPEFLAEDHVYPEKYIPAWMKTFTSVKLDEFIQFRQQLFSELTLEANAGMLLK